MPETNHRNYLQYLRLNMGHSLNNNELRTLAFDLGIDWDELEGESKSNKIIALISLAMRNNNLNSLLNELKQIRPNLDWPETPREFTNGTFDENDYFELTKGLRITKTGVEHKFSAPASCLWIIIFVISLILILGIFVFFQ